MKVTTKYQKSRLWKVKNKFKQRFMKYKNVDKSTVTKEVKKKKYNKRQLYIFTMTKNV